MFVSRPNIKEERLREIIEDEIITYVLVNEGIWDDVKDGAKKLIAAVSQKVQGLGVVDKVKEILASMTSMPKDIQSVIDAIKQAMSQSGEQLQLNSTLQMAKEIGKLTSESMGEMLKSDLEGPIHAQAQKLQGESSHSREVLLTINEINTICDKNKKLNEAGIIGITGMSLAGFGAILMIFKGLEKLANLLGAKKVAGVLHKVHHVLHTVEEKAIDFIVPDTLSFILYNFLHARGFDAKTKLKRTLSREEYSKNLYHVKSKTEKLAYSALLLFFAWNGIRAAMHAGVSLLGFAEGAATTVKGIEIGQASAHIADIMQLAIED